MEKIAIAEIQLKKIILLSSEFVRHNHREAVDITVASLNLGITPVIDEDTIEVSVQVLINETEDLQLQSGFAIQVTMMGIFEKIGSAQLSDNEFTQINAPAIIYPYIRQHIRALSLDAGIDPILIPLVNFQKVYEQNQSQ